MLSPNRTTARITAIATLFAGLIAAPFIAFAGDPAQASKATPDAPPSAGDQTAVLQGRVTDEAGGPLAGVCVRVLAMVDPGKRFVDTIAYRDQLQTISDVNGGFRLELPRTTKRQSVLIDAQKRGFRGLRGTPMIGPIEVAPGTPAKVSLKLGPGAYFAGKVVDERGAPIDAVKINAQANASGGSGGIETTESHADGTFEIFNYPTVPRTLRGAVTKGVVYFSHPDYIDGKLDDIYAVSEKEREALRVILNSGYKIGGKVLDVGGKPVPKAMVKLVRKDSALRKATLTDANGKFALRGVSDGLTMLTARALDIRQQKYLPMAVKSDKVDLEIRLKLIEWPADLKKYNVLGMVLADVTPELRTTYDLSQSGGALVLDPGKDSDRLKVGRLAEGYNFWMVGRTRIGGVTEFISQILVETAGQNANEYLVRVVYTFSTVDGDGSNTAFLKLTNDDLKQLQGLAGQLSPEAP